MVKIKATTVLAVKHNDEVVLAGDGQVTLGNAVMKHGANKIRELNGGKILAGFAGSAADAFTLFERFEHKLKELNNHVGRAAIELAKDWRTDKYLRKLEAMMVVADKDSLFVLSGGGDVIEPDDGVVGIGSGGTFALSAARALVRANVDGMSAESIAEISMNVAAELCPYTNSNIKIKQVKS